MKTIIKAMAAIGLAATPIHAGISLAWQYQFSGATVGQPSITFYIHETLVSPSGYIAAEVRGMSMDPAHAEQRVVLLAPDGHAVWTSANIIPDPMMMDYETIRFTHVSDGALCFVTTGMGTGPYRYHMYNAKHGPELVSKFIGNDAMSGEVLEISDMMTGVEAPASTFSSTAFYVKVPDMMAMGGSSVIRKYVLDVASSTTVVAQSVAGTSGSNFQLSWDSVPNVQYQVEESADMATWTASGGALNGTGSTMSWSAPISSTGKYYRVVQL